MTTFASIIQSVQTELALMGGVDVQTYAQPRIAQKLQRVFNFAYKARFWRRHRNYNTYTLDGTTGIVTTDLSAIILNFEDIQHVWLNSNRSPLPEAPTDINPTLITQPSIQAITTAAAGKFRVLPVDTTGTVTIAYRTRPDTFTDESDVPFDDDYLILRTAGEYAIENGTNPSAAQMKLTDAQKIWQQLINKDYMAERTLHSSAEAGIYDWSTR